MRSFTEIDKNLSRIKGLDTYKEALENEDIVILEIDRYNSDNNEFELKSKVDGYKCIMSFENSKDIKKTKFNKVAACMVDSIDEENKTIYVNRKRANEWYKREVIDKLKDGDTVKGKIVNFSDVKVYVEVGCGYVVKLGMSDLSYTRILNIHDYFKGISEIIMKVYTDDNGEIKFSLKNMLESSKDIIERFNIGDEAYAIVDAVYEDSVRVRLRPNLISKCFGVKGLEVGDTVKVKVIGKRLSGEENTNNFLDIEFVEKSDKKFRNSFYYGK